MPAALRNALVWCLLVLVPAGWITLSALEAASGEEAAAAEGAPSIDAVTALKGRMFGVMGPTALAEPDPLGTRPMARLAAAMLLARAGDRERAEAEWKLATESSSRAPEPELADAVHRLLAEWPVESQGRRDLRPDALDADQWTLVQRRLGWFGDLARAEFTGDPESVQRARVGDPTLLLVLMLAAVWFFGVGAVGCVALVTVLVLALRGRIHSGIAPSRRVHAVLGETFIAWMLLFLGMHLVLGRLGDGSEPAASRIWLAFAAGFASLGALGWARWCGLSWSELRDAAGLRFEGGAWRLAWMSATSYACALPCMGAGIALGMLLADALGGRSFQDVTHPVQDLLPGAPASMKFALFALAAVGAPIVEEIAFRGLLYGHVRQRTSAWPRAASIGLAMLFSATVFAAIHPQGVLAVPALAGVSLGFCITREWSGSVVPGMVAHGVHNGLLLAMNLGLQAA